MKFLSVHMAEAGCPEAAVTEAKANGKDLFAGKFSKEQFEFMHKMASDNMFDNKGQMTKKLYDKKTLEKAATVGLKLTTWIQPCLNVHTALFTAAMKEAGMSPELYADTLFNHHNQGWNAED